MPERGGAPAAGGDRIGGRRPQPSGALAQQAALAAHAPLGPAHHAQQLHHLALRHRLAVEEALPVLAADRAQEADVVLGLDALDDHLLAELVRQRHDRAQDHRAGAVLAAGLQERAVDLDGVEGELVEIGQRGIAGAEIVERQAGAGVRQLAQHGGRLLRVLHHQRLGDLEPQRALGDHGAAEDVAHLVDQLRPEQLPARDVDADEQRRVGPRQLLLPAQPPRARHGPARRSRA